MAKAAGSALKITSSSLRSSREAFAPVWPYQSLSCTNKRSTASDWPMLSMSSPALVAFFIVGPLWTPVAEDLFDTRSLIEVARSESNVSVQIPVLRSVRTATRREEGGE